MIETTWLRAFAAFAEDANMSRAARRLHLSQPAVHAQLRRLSEALGVALYRRVGRGLQLTPAGVEVAAFAREHDERSQELVARLGGRTREGRLVLAAGTGALLYVVGAGLQSYQRRRGGTLDLLTLDAPSAIEAVRSGSAHVGVAALDADPEGLRVHALTAAEQALVVPREHPLARRRRASIEDLAGQRLVLPPEGRPHRAMIEGAARARGVRLEVGAIARGWELTLRLVELGFGLGIVNGCCRVPAGLVTLPLRELPPVRYVTFARGRTRQDAEELMLALVEKGEAWRTRSRMPA